jgi:ABC-2 type transport system permease protein
VWIISLLLGNLATASSFAELYGDPDELGSIVATMGSPAGLAMTGPRHYLSDYTFGAMMSHEMIGFVGVLVALMSIMIVVRHTRTEEETGRAELVRSTVIGRHAPLAGALITAVIANVLLAGVLAIGLAAMGLETIDLAGGLLYGAAHAAIGVVFAGIAAITVQITPHARGAIGMAMALAGLAYGLRAIGDVSEDETLSWLTPIGWSQRTYAYLDNDWWPLLLSAGLAIVTAGLGFWLSTRRDVGAGLRATRQGRATASALLRTPIGHAIRLHRGLFIGFAAGVFLVGVMYGSILGSVEEMFAGIEQIGPLVEQTGGGSIIMGFASTVLIIQALICSAYLVITGLRPRAEENGGRAEPLLSTGLSRTGWVGSHAVVAAGGGVLLLMITGLGLGVAGAGSTGDQDMIWRMSVAALAYAPALWIVLGLTVALYGWVPRLAALGWLPVVYGFIVGYMGELLQFPDWLSSPSPFGHVPRVPAADLEWTPLVVLTAIAAALLVFGLFGFRRRDLQLK